MPDDDKQKKKKAPGRKARGQMTRNAHRGATHSNLAFERYMRPSSRSGLFLAKVLKGLGNGRFEVFSREDGNTYTPRISGDLRLGGRAARNPMVRTAITPGDYVLTDGSRIDAVLTSQQAGQARKKIGIASRSKSRSANSLFSWGSAASANMEEKLKARKKTHKQGKNVRGSRSVSGSRSGTRRSGSGSASGTRSHGSKGSKGSRASSRKGGPARRAADPMSRRSRAAAALAAAANEPIARERAAAAAAENAQLAEEAEANAYFTFRKAPAAWNK